MKRTGEAVWRGTGKEGSGTLTTPSGVLSAQPYSFTLRFVDEHGTAGTNPEELIAAAHAGCFSMALSFQLTGAGHAPDELHTTAELTMEQQPVGWTITGIVLHLRARVPGIDAAQFAELADKAKAGCPVSRALGAVPITLDAVLEA